jgi:hypothetical protein
MCRYTFCNDVGINFIFGKLFINRYFCKHITAYSGAVVPKVCFADAERSVDSSQGICG